MNPIDTSITKCSYVLKRLRDSGYKAEKIVGSSNPESLEKEFLKSMDKIFLEEKTYTPKEIKENLSFIKKDLKKFFGYTPEYNEKDSRVWTILIDGGESSIFLTLFLNSKGSEDLYEEYGQDYLEINDGNQYIRPFRKKLNTLSFEVIAQELNNLGIVGKIPN